MTAFTVKNVGEALPLLIRTLDKEGARDDSRNGEVLSLYNPVAVTYLRPWERYVMDYRRRNNVAFLVMEGLWMLAGREDVAWLSRFNEQMKVYSDNGKTFHGAYGYRLRRGMVDQLDECAAMLKADPTTRRAVAQIWDQRIDLCSTSLDIPCNDLIMFRVIDGFVLDMTICNRSNDLVWGMCGANAAHFSMIHEYVAAKSEMRQGRYTQFSNNLHMYLDTPRLDELRKIPLLNGTWYDTHRKLVPLVSNIEQFDKELLLFMTVTNPVDNERVVYEFEEPFFEDVAKPLYNFWITRKYTPYSAVTWMDDIAKIKDDAVKELAREWSKKDGNL